MYTVYFGYGRNPVDYDDAREAAEAITEDDSYVDYMEPDINESLDECYGRIEICGQDFWASNILKELDEDAYNDYYREEQVSCAQGDIDYVEDTLEGMSDGDEEHFAGGDIRVIYREGEEEEDEYDSEESFETSFYSLFAEA